MLISKCFLFFLLRIKMAIFIINNNMQITITATTAPTIIKSCKLEDEPSPLVSSTKPAIIDMCFILVHSYKYNIRMGDNLLDINH